MNKTYNSKFLCVNFVTLTLSSVCILCQLLGNSVYVTEYILYADFFPSCRYPISEGNTITFASHCKIKNTNEQNSLVIKDYILPTLFSCLVYRTLHVFSTILLNLNGSTETDPHLYLFISHCPQL